jgi:hypothetical protein
MKTSILSTIVISLFLLNIAFAQNGRNIKNSDKNKNEVVTVKGSVTSINHPIAVVKGDDGKNYELRLGPSWYWKQNNLDLKDKGTVEVNGELEKNSSKNFIYPYTIIQGGKTITLADKDGKPLWAGSKKHNGKSMGQMRGNGNRNGNGNMKGNCGGGRGNGCGNN